MKKLMAIMTVLFLLMTGTVAFAEGTTAGHSTKTNLTNRLQDLRAKAEEVKPTTDKIKANRTELLSLRAEARTVYDKAKAKVKDMQQNKDTLTPAQIESLKSSLKALQESKKILTGTIGEIGEEIPDLRVAIKERDFESTKNLLENIEKVQSLRIVEVKKVIVELNKIIAL